MGFWGVGIDVFFSYVRGYFVRYKYIERKKLISN